MHNMQNILCDKFSAYALTPSIKRPCNCMHPMRGLPQSFPIPHTNKR